MLGANIQGSSQKHRLVLVLCLAKSRYIRDLGKSRISVEAVSSQDKAKFTLLNSRKKSKKFQHLCTRAAAPVSVIKGEVNLSRSIR